MFVMIAVWRPTTLSIVLLMRAYLVYIIKNVKAKLWRRKMGGHSLLIPILKTAMRSINLSEEHDYDMLLFQRAQSLSPLL